MDLLSVLGVWVSADASKRRGHTQNSILDPSWTIPMEGYAFGLTNGPARFTRLMNLALSEPTSTHCLAYSDDIIMWAPSLEEHLHCLRLLFDRIRTAALTLKPT